MRLQLWQKNVCMKIKCKNLKSWIKVKKKLIKNYNLGICKYHKIFRLLLTGIMWEQALEDILLKSDIAR